MRPSDDLLGAMVFTAISEAVAAERERCAAILERRLLKASGLAFVVIEPLVGEIRGKP
jgi:hypothetical protein